MKKIIRDIVLMILAVIGVLFAVVVIFGNRNEKSMFESIGDGMGTVSQKAYTSDIATELEENKYVEIPTIHYIGGSRTVGDEVYLADMFEIEYADGTIVPASSDDKTAIYLVDIRDSLNNIIIENLTTEQIESLEEIPAAFVFDKEQSILYFHKSGVFTVYIKVYTESQSGVLCEFMIPVEVGD